MGMARRGISCVPVLFLSFSKEITLCFYIILVDGSESSRHSWESVCAWCLHLCQSCRHQHPPSYGLTCASLYQLMVYTDITPADSNEMETVDWYDAEGRYKSGDGVICKPGSIDDTWLRGHCSWSLWGHGCLGNLEEGNDGVGHHCLHAAHTGPGEPILHEFKFGIQSWDIQKNNGHMKG